MVSDTLEALGPQRQLTYVVAAADVVAAGQTWSPEEQTWSLPKLMPEAVYGHYSAKRRKSPELQVYCQSLALGSRSLKSLRFA